MKRQKGRKCFLLFQAFFNSWKARAVQPNPQHLFLFHCPHTCFAGASFRRVLQKKRKTKKFSARPRFSSLPSAVLSCGLLKPCWLPPQPAETSGGCSYQVTHRSSLTDQFIPVSIAIENFPFHLKSSVPKYIFHSQSFTSYWPFSANACSFISIYRALYYLRLLNYFSNGLNIIFLGPSLSQPVLNIFANHGSQINHIRIFQTLENIDLQQNQSQRAVPCQNCPNAPASVCRWVWKNLKIQNSKTKFSDFTNLS